MAAEIRHISNLSTSSIRESSLDCRVLNYIIYLPSYLTTGCHGQKYLRSSLEVQQGVLVKMGGSIYRDGKYLEIVKQLSAFKKYLS